jgi:LPXTG-site transpeptidase (sortase) family protein
VTGGRDPVIRRHRRRAGQRRTILAAIIGALTGAAVLAAGTVAAGTLGFFSPTGAAAVSGAWLAPPAAAAASGKPAPPGLPPHGEPTRVRIPSIDVDVPLERLGLDSAGALEAPDSFDKAGWYAAGTIPGDVGPAVIAGHIDSECCPAVFYKLDTLKPGDKVEVERGGDWLTFVVTSTGQYPKTAFPTSQVYGATPDAELRLITCGGQFDHSAKSYLDNVVVYAVESST